MAKNINDDVLENCQKQSHNPGNNDPKLSLSDRLANKRLRRGHFWLWRNKREIMNDNNFVEVSDDFVVRERKVKIEIKSKNVKIRRHRKINRHIEFHNETLGEWLMNRRYSGMSDGEIKFVNQDFAADYDERMEAWNERFVNKGLKRGHLWLWWNRRSITNDKNFLEIDKSFIVPESKVEIKVRSQKRKIKFHDETLEEWLIQKILFHGNNLIRDMNKESKKSLKRKKAKKAK